MDEIEINNETRLQTSHLSLTICSICQHLANTINVNSSEILSSDVEVVCHSAPDDDLLGVGFQDVSKNGYPMIHHRNFQ